MSSGGCCGEREACGHRPATCWHRSDGQCAAYQGHPFTHGHQAVSSRAGRLTPAHPVIDDAHQYFVLAVAHLHVRARLAGVPRDVRQRLLHQAVQRQIDRGRERADVAADVEVDRQAARAHLVHQSGS